MASWGGYAAVEHVTDLYYRHQGLDTAKGAQGLPGKEGELQGYGPTTWLTLRRLLPARSIGPGDVFVDYGCGKGRTLAWVSSKSPARRVIGLERDPALCAIAVENIEHLRGRLRCEDVRVICTDAASWDVPDDVTVAYFCDPFRGAAFEGAFRKLQESLARSPRALRVVYVHPTMHTSVLKSGFVVQTQSYNRSWISTTGPDGSSSSVGPWLPPLRWAVYVAQAQRPAPRLGCVSEPEKTRAARQPDWPSRECCQG